MSEEKQAEPIRPLAGYTPLVPLEDVSARFDELVTSYHKIYPGENETLATLTELRDDWLSHPDYGALSDFARVYESFGADTLKAAQEQLAVHSISPQERRLYEELNYALKQFNSDLYLTMFQAYNNEAKKPAPEKNEKPKSKFGARKISYTDMDNTSEPTNGLPASAVAPRKLRELR